MNTELVKQAVELFVETIPMDTMDVDHPQFHHLYSQECKLYDCIRRMSEGECEEYGRQVADMDPEVKSILDKLNDMIK
jgi:hypothetical protein